MFIHGSNILKCYRKEKSHFCKMYTACYRCSGVGVSFVIANISLVKFHLPE